MPRHSAWNRTISDDRRAPRAGDAQVGDRPAAIGDGQQHRVEREQEAEQRADRREQAAGQVARAERLAQQRDVLVGRRRLPIRPPAERAASSARTAASARACVCTKMRVTLPGRPASCCRCAQRHHGHARVRERAGGFVAEHGRDLQRRERGRAAAA